MEKVEASCMPYHQFIQTIETTYIQGSVKSTEKFY